MKNIAQYFEETVKCNNGTPIHPSDNTKEDTESKYGSKGKRNRVKIKISRTSAKERVCDILESSSDMVDKTPSPFAKVNNVDRDQHDTPKRSLSKLVSPVKNNNSSNQRLNYLTLETNDMNGKHKRQRKKDNAGTCSNENKKSKKEESNKTKRDNDVNGDTDIIDVLDINSDDGLENSQDGSNAFHILMSRNKPSQNVSISKLLPQNDEASAKKTEESKEKLKRSKEKLIALADKKGYSKRKLAEIEEGERIERTIQNRIKLFKGEEKKDNCMSTTVLNQKQSSGSLLNYFSKAPADLLHTNTANLSTIVVKADIHVNANDGKHNLYRSNLSSGTRTSRKSKKSGMELPEMDDICIIESENINTSNTKNKLQDELQLNKRRWSLRIKLQAAENGNSALGESSDDELYSPRSKVKINVQNSKESGINNTIVPENLPTKNKTKKVISKQMNERMKLKLKKHEETECLENTVMIDDNSDFGKNLKKKPESMKLDKHKSASVQDKKFNSDSNTNLRDIKNDKTNHEDCIIINDNNTKRKTTDKLAPLFTKRRKPDPEVLAARRLFLQPDIMDNNNKNTSRKVNVCGTLAFPRISHITQLNNTVCNESNNFNIPREVCNKYVPIPNVSNFKHLVNFSETKIKQLEKVNKPKVQEVLTDIEKRCSDAKQMWDVISLIDKKQPKKIISPKGRFKKNKQLEKKETTESNSIEEQLKSSSWTFKYRPKSTQEVVGNEEAAAKLREWLIGWRATFTNEDGSSGDEFYSSDSNHSKIIENNQVAVLLGPHGCGKTASVYAVAEEFGYTVLELNASSRRTGKKILKELEEATKSHRIKKDEKASSLCASVSDEFMPKKMPQNSLILIEDVDIIFDEDEGFVSGTYQLASNTKRPIVMTCRDVCPHLNRMAPQQNRIYFQDAIGNRVSAFLELISLAETGYRLPSNYVTELLQSGDLRKAILQLQYLLLSGPPRALEQSINFKNAFWQNLRYFLYKPAIKVGKKRKKKKATDNEVSNDNTNMLIDVASKLDNIALLSSLVNVEDSALHLWEIKMQPNLSLIENTAPYSASSNICLEIAEWIGSKVMYKDQLNEHEGIQCQNTIMLKKQLNKGVNFALSQTTSLLLDRYVLATDYFPSVRSICRAEESRAITNSKRGNRFFHYLHNLKAPSTLLKPNVLAAACKIMYDKVDSSMQTSEDNTSLI